MFSKILTACDKTKCWSFGEGGNYVAWFQSKNKELLIISIFHSSSGKITWMNSPHVKTFLSWKSRNSASPESFSAMSVILFKRLRSNQIQWNIFISLELYTWMWSLCCIWSKDFHYWVSLINFWHWIFLSHCFYNLIFIAENQEVNRFLK